MVIDPTPIKVLVTGANGFIGLHTVLHFLQRGYNLCATVRTQEQGEKVRQTLAKHTPTSKLEFTYGWSVSLPSSSPRPSPWWIHSAGTIPFRSNKPGLCWDGARPYEGTIVEMAQSMIEQGMI